MTVKCFAEMTKDQICLAYSHKTMCLSELARHFTTSTRTIGRVLEERGLATPIPRLKGEAYALMKLMLQYNMTVDQLKTILTAPAAPVIDNQTVQTYLDGCSEEELGGFVYKTLNRRTLQKLSITH